MAAFRIHLHSAVFFGNGDKCVQQNTLMREWDPKMLHSPLQLLVPDPEYEKDSVPFAPAKPMVVNIPTTSLGRGNCFIDDIVKVYLCRPEKIKGRVMSAPPAVHKVMRPFAGEKKLVFGRGQHLLSKLIAEETPKEIQMVLGWLIDTRMLIVSLPNDKYLPRKNNIQKNH